MTGSGDLWCRIVGRSNADLQRVIDAMVTDPSVVRSVTLIGLSELIGLRTEPLVRQSASLSGENGESRAMATLTDAGIARWRLRNQHLTRPQLPAAADVVEHLLAVQAENAQQSAWAVAGRTATPDPADLGGLLDSGAVLRTHMLRSTWHYTRAEDVVWLIELTSPRILKVTAQQLTELDDRALDRATRRCWTAWPPMAT